MCGTMLATVTMNAMYRGVCGNNCEKIQYLLAWGNAWWFVDNQIMFMCVGFPVCKLYKIVFKVGCTGHGFCPQ